MSDMIVVSDHSPHWAAQFQELRDRLAPHVADIAVAIEHVGSTSVPGCAAKPIIDLDIVVADTSAMTELVTRLTGQGYRHEGDLGITGREAFRAPDAPTPTTCTASSRGPSPIWTTSCCGTTCGCTPKRCGATAS